MVEVILQRLHYSCHLTWCQSTSSTCFQRIYEWKQQILNSEDPRVQLKGLKGCHLAGHHFKKSLWVVHMNPVPCVWKKEKRNLSKRICFSSPRKFFQSLNRYFVPSIAFFCTHNYNFHSFWCIIYKIPIWFLPTGICRVLSLLCQERRRQQKN